MGLLRHPVFPAYRQAGIGVPPSSTAGRRNDRIKGQITLPHLSTYTLINLFTFLFINHFPLNPSPPFGATPDKLILSYFHHYQQPHPQQPHLRLSFLQNLRHFYLRHSAYYQRLSVLHTSSYQLPEQRLIILQKSF